jgi:hypothetical protein
MSMDRVLLEKSLIAELVRKLWNQKFPYHVCKSRPVPDLSQTDPARIIIISYFRVCAFLVPY